MKQDIKIYRPCRTNSKTQGFGESKACIAVDYHRNIIYPAQVVGKKNGVCPIGYASFYETLGLKGHNGEDWACWGGESLYFPIDTIDKNGYTMKWFAKSEIDDAGGIGIDVYSIDRIYFEKCPEPSGNLYPPENAPNLIKREWEENNGWLYCKFRFWHLKETWVKDNSDQWIEFGDFIGKGDSTGASGGNHLHWAFKITDSNHLTLDNQNGYMGAVDWNKNQCFENVFVGDVIKIKEQALTALDWASKVINDVLIFLGKLGRGAEVEQSLLDRFCLAIQDIEGWWWQSRSWRNKNPGNLRFMGQEGTIGHDKQGFAIFKNYENGFRALRRIVERANEGGSKIYHKDMDLYQFFQKYAPASDNNRPYQYAQSVAKKLDIPITTTLWKLEHGGDNSVE